MGRVDAPPRATEKLPEEIYINATSSTWPEAGKANSSSACFAEELVYLSD
jgi:hypothetical protein